VGSSVCVGDATSLLNRLWCGLKCLLLVARMRHRASLL
jgi:hypothetical protein